MYRIVALLAAAAASAAGQTCNLAASPEISHIQNGAALVDGPLAPGAIIAIFGQNLQAPGVQRGATVADLGDSRFPLELGCIAVEIDNRRAPVLYAQANQVNAQIPIAAPPGGRVNVQVIANPGTQAERRSGTFSILLSPAAPAFFRLLPTPCILAQFAGTTDLTGDPALFAPDLRVRGVRPGDIVVMYATGLGLTEPVYQAGEIPSAAAVLRERIDIEWTQRFGATAVVDPADILYAGLVPGAISGLYQINLRIRGEYLAFGAQNQVRIRAGGVLSPAGTTIYVAPQ